MEQPIGLYIHIPFCIQRCHYCDFATYAKDQIAANDHYVENLCRELQLRKKSLLGRPLKTIYFGGGTPSLLKPEQVQTLLQATRDVGLLWEPNIEITLEVNPATLNDDKARFFAEIGVNRISLGCQSFDDHFLKLCGREHNSKDSFKTIDLIKKYFSNFSLDLLFSLPEQGLKMVEKDVSILCDIDPPHISAYCLTLPEKHPFNRDRCSEDEMIEMFDHIEKKFKNNGLKRYEISNFAKPGFESVHNSLYWLDKDYVGIGLSAHSYLKDESWGVRFWNPSQYNTYMDLIENHPTSERTPYEKGLHENLTIHESLTDYCHTHLRTAQGLEIASLRQKYGDKASLHTEKRLNSLKKNQLVKLSQGTWTLTRTGVLVSNSVFSTLLFSQGDIDKVP